MRFLIPLLFTLFVLSVSAQNDYQLRQPTAQEYVDVMQNYADKARNEDNFPHSTIYQFVEMSEILLKRYDEVVSIDFETLFKLYDNMFIGDSFNSVKDEWGQILVHSWLNENHPDLSQITYLEFETIRIDVTPRDFDHDGDNEYLLDVQIGEPTDRAGCGYYAQIVDYMIVEQTNIDYEFIETGLPWGTITRGGAFNEGELKIIEYDYRDMTGDGREEWLILTGGETFGGPAMGYENTGRLHILSWTGGGFIDITQFSDRYPYSVTYYSGNTGCGTVYPHDVSWELENIDDDPAIEIFQRQVYQDNWECETFETKILDWSSEENRYIEQEVLEGYVEETRLCLQRQAEEAMWDDDYSQAIDLYQQSLNSDFVMSSSLADLKDDNSENFAQFHQPTLDFLHDYSIARLKLANILLGHVDEARQILINYPRSYLKGHRVKLLNDYFNILDQYIDNPLKACIASFTYFTENFPSYIIGTTYTKEMQTIEYIPENIGCDAPKMIDEEISNLANKQLDHPVVAIEQLGFPIRQTSQADFDLDGDNEILIWLEVPVPPILFSSTAKGYVISRPVIDPYLQVDSLSTIVLPDDSGIGIISYQLGYSFYPKPPWFLIYDRLGAGGVGGGQWACGTIDEYISYAEIRVWRMEGDIFTDIFDGSVCTQSAEDLFTGEDNHIIDGGVQNNQYPEENEPLTKPIAYIWDSEQKTYIRQGATSTMNANDTTYEPPPESKYYSVWYAFYADDYTYIIDEILDISDMNPHEIQWGEQFLLGISYQAIGNVDEAIMTFQMIVDESPDEGWQMLAKLHIVENYP